MFNIFEQAPTINDYVFKHWKNVLVHELFFVLKQINKSNVNMNKKLDIIKNYIFKRDNDWLKGGVVQKLWKCNQGFINEFLFQVHHVETNNSPLYGIIKEHLLELENKNTIPNHLISILLNNYDKLYNKKNPYVFLAVNLYVGFVKNYINNLIDKDYFRLLLLSLEELTHVTPYNILEIYKYIFKMYYKLLSDSIGYQNDTETASKEICDLCKTLYLNVGYKNFLGVFLYFYTKKIPYILIDDTFVMLQKSLRKNVYHVNHEFNYKKLSNIFERNPYTKEQSPFYNFRYVYLIKYNKNEEEAIKMYGKYKGRLYNTKEGKENIEKMFNQRKNISSFHYKTIKFQEYTSDLYMDEIDYRSKTPLYTFSQSDRDWIKTFIIQDFLDQEFVDFHIQDTDLDLDIEMKETQTEEMQTTETPPSSVADFELYSHNEKIKKRNTNKRKINIKDIRNLKTNKSSYRSSNKIHVSIGFGGLGFEIN
jgi:hypothetical protein